MSTAKVDRVLNLKSKTLLSYQYDRMARCAYLTFSLSDVARTVEHVPNSVNVDVDKKGEVVGHKLVTKLNYFFFHCSLVCLDLSFACTNLFFAS